MKYTTQLVRVLSAALRLAFIAAVPTACSSDADSPSSAPGGTGGYFQAGAGGAFGGVGGTAPMASGGAIGNVASGGAPAGNGCGADKAHACMNAPLLDAFPKEPAGQWTYHEVAGTTCRDGSPAGFYTRMSDTSKQLLIYLEQGGACFNSALCQFNPVKVADSMTGRTLSEAIGGLKPGVRQEPQKTGIFDYTNAQNPYKDWNAVWVPYCTGDAFGGSNPNATVPGVDGVQHFTGHTNMVSFIGHVVPTFPGMQRVVLTGTSAGSFGSGLNFNMVQDTFGQVPVTLIMDSGIPFSDAFMSPCLQKQWRDLWKFESILPPDCADCNHPDGGGLMNLVFYSAKKYPNVKLGVISAAEDDIMKFFFGFGENNCGPGGGYAQGKYTQGIADLRAQGAPYRTQFSSYVVPGIKHMYSQFDEFYTPLAGGVPLVAWENDVLSGNMHDVGP